MPTQRHGTFKTTVHKVAETMPQNIQVKFGKQSKNKHMQERLLGDTVLLSSTKSHPAQGVPIPHKESQIENTKR